MLRLSPSVLSRRFGMYVCEAWAASVVALLWLRLGSWFEQDITHWMTKETTKVTSDVMNDEEFQASVQSLAKHVVDEVLRDPGLFSQAKDVVVTLLVSPDTQATLLQVSE